MCGGCALTLLERACLLDDVSSPRRCGRAVNVAVGGESGDGGVSCCLGFRLAVEGGSWDSTGAHGQEERARAKLYIASRQEGCAT